jgi:RimJ/RimL family protein N-acetyltransferase
MIEFKRLTHEDYYDIVDISKDIWGGTDYLPKVFHKWIDDKGYFLGAVDASKNKVVAVGKFSILLDKSGWLEGLRVHKDYRGLKIARDISEKLINIAKQFKAEGNINKIAFGTYIDNKESITLMKKLGFELEQSFHLFSKQYEDLNTNLSLKDFNVQSWDLSYDDFLNLPYIKKRNNLVDLAFVFQEPTRSLYDELKADGAFITINSHNGIFKVKGEPNFAVEDDSFEAINTFMNYCLLKYKDLLISTPISSITNKDKATIEQLKEANFDSWSDWQLDYLYYVLR